MDKLENLEDKIKKNYKIVQNYLNGNPGAEGFLDSLADLQTNFADYLIEVLKTKEYGKEDVTKSNIYQGHIKGGKYKYIDNEVLEHIISNEVLGKKVSINSLLNEGIKKLEELFDTQKSLEDAFKSGKLQCIQLGVILPSNDLPGPITGSDKGLEKKNLSQNKFRLFISILRELGIYDDDLIIYSGKVDKDMMRENTYYAIFIPRINKTVFLNTGYGEATFVCEGKVSIKNMTTLGKEKLQNALGAIKINFSENNIIGWKNEIKIALLGEGGKVGKKIPTKNIRDKISELNELNNFYAEHKNDTFIDSKGKEASIWELIFNGYKYYKKNYKKINDNSSYHIKLTSDPSSHFHLKWNVFLQELGIQKIEKLEDLKAFYTDHKNDTFIDSNGETSTIEKLFSTNDYYKENYKRIFFLFNIRIPGDLQGMFHKSWTEIKQEITDNNIEIISLEDLKAFYTDHKNDTFIDSNGKPSTIKKLFSNSKYYKDNYKLINPENGFGFTLPSHPNRYYGKAKKWTWNNFIREIGIDYNVKISLKDLQDFFAKNQNRSFTDSKNKKSTLEQLFSSIEYYKHNYINANNALNILLPGNPMAYYNMTWDEIKKSLGLL